MLRLLFILLVACFLASTAIAVDDTDSTPIQALVEQAKKALARNNFEKVQQIFAEIYELTTGLDAEADIPIKDRPTVDIQNRLCPYRKAIAPLLTAQELEHLHHQMRVVAFGVVKKKEEDAPFVRAIIECVRDNGEPVAESKALQDGLNWARKLHAADIDGIRAMGREYERLFERYPDNLFYDLLNSFIKGKIDDIRWENERQEFKKRYPVGILFRQNLVNKAHKGGLAAQLELSRRLETGHNFRQDNAMAYFWYQRALKNGGGEFAQNGMDRLYPRLSELELWLVDMWTKEGHRPY